MLTVMGTHGQEHTHAQLTHNTNTTVGSTLVGLKWYHPKQVNSQPALHNHSGYMRGGMRQFNYIHKVVNLVSTRPLGDFICVRCKTERFKVSTKQNQIGSNDIVMTVQE